MLVSGHQCASAMLVASSILYAGLVNAAGTHFVLHTFKPIVQARIDPIMAPGQVSQHTHHVIGASGFNATYDPDKLRQSKCSNTGLQADKSNYWQPAVYRIVQGGRFEAQQTGTRVYYNTLEDSELSDGLKMEPFPYNFQMVAGDPYRKTRNMTWDNPDWYQMFYCQIGNGGYETYTLPREVCDVLITKVYFPTCWNGQPFDINNPSAHMRYAYSGFFGTHCPEGYMRRFPQMLMESFHWKSDTPNNEGEFQYILANGDLTGYGLHADFQNGWDTNVLTQALAECRSTPIAEPPNEACAAFAPSFNDTAGEFCMYEGLIPDEGVGYGTSLRSLPGCNAVWGNDTVKPRCNPKMWAGDPKWTAPIANDRWQWSVYQSGP